MSNYRTPRRDLLEVKKGMEHVITVVMPLVKGDLQKATDLLFVPLPKVAGSTAIELIRRGYTDQAASTLKDMLQTQQREKEAKELKLLNAQRPVMV